MTMGKMTEQAQQTLTSPLQRRKQPQPTLTPLHLPFDLVVEILCRVPVKHLIQFRCVCKSWNSLISRDSDFAKKQLRHGRHHLILIPTQSSPEFLLLHSPISSIFNSTSTTTVKHFRYSLKDILNKGYCRYGASACDGMLCFRIDESLAILCNPSIRKFKILPPLKFPYEGYIQIYTLVYDRFISNYKIIAITFRSSKVEVNVHTLGTNYWRRIHDFPGPLLPMPKSGGIFVNDSVNWLTYDFACPAMLIVSLDLEKESYQKLSLPVFDVQVRISSLTLGTLRGCLSLLFNRRDEFFDIWIMKEYGNEKSWAKLLSVPHMKDCGFCHYTKVLYISEDDQVLMECFKKEKYSLVIYDSINNMVKIPNFQDNIHLQTTPKVYVESLISPL